MAAKRFNWNAYHEIIPGGVTNTDGVLVHADQSIVYVLMSSDFPDDYDVAGFIMAVVRSRYKGNYPVRDPLGTLGREEAFYKMWFRFDPNDAEEGRVWQDIEYAEICIDPLRYEVMQILHRLHTIEQLKYTYSDLDDLETKIQEYFGYQYDRMLKGIG